MKKILNIFTNYFRVAKLKKQLWKAVLRFDIDERARLGSELFGLTGDRNYLLPCRLCYDGDPSSDHLDERCALCRVKIRYHR